MVKYVSITSRNDVEMKYVIVSYLLDSKELLISQINVFY